jgi:proline-specific peptidase
MKPLVLLADEGHPVIFYDQAGCGASSRDAAEHPARDTPWLLTVDYYVDELCALLQAHGLGGVRGQPRERVGRGEGYYVYGLSWGSMLAQEFAVAQPSGLRGLILSGALADGDLYIRTQWRDRISTMPSFTQKLLRELEDSARYSSDAYRRLDAVLSTHFTTRQVPKLEGSRHKRPNLAIYAGMQGESEFTFGGALKGWRIVERNGSITVPTLVLAGEFDTMSIECHQQVCDSIPTAWPLVVIPRAAHVKEIDEPQLVVAAVAKFLSTCEKTREIATF